MLPVKLWSLPTSHEAGEGVIEQRRTNQLQIRLQNPTPALERGALMLVTAADELILGIVNSVHNSQVSVLLEHEVDGSRLDRILKSWHSADDSSENP